MEGWVSLVGWPIADALPTKWSHVNHGSGVDQCAISIDITLHLLLRYQTPSTSDRICKRRSSVFCHVARLPASTPAYQALKLQVDLSLNRFPSADWKCRPCRPHGLWVDQLRQYNHSPADLWRSAIRRGHFGATLRFSLTTRRRRRHKRRLRFKISWPDPYFKWHNHPGPQMINLLKSFLSNALFCDNLQKHKYS